MNHDMITLYTHTELRIVSESSENSLSASPVIINSASYKNAAARVVVTDCPISTELYLVASEVKVCQIVFRALRVILFLKGFIS